MGNIEATCEKRMVPAQVVGKNESHEEVRIVEKGSASGDHKSERSMWLGTVRKNSLEKAALPLGPEH